MCTPAAQGLGVEHAHLSNVERHKPSVLDIVTAQRHSLLPKRIGACKRQEILHWWFKKFHATNDEVEPLPLQWHKTDALVVRYRLHKQSKSAPRLPRTAQSSSGSWLPAMTAGGASRRNDAFWVVGRLYNPQLDQSLRK